jgi:hypothetical protein
MVNDSGDAFNATVKLKVFGSTEYLCLYAIQDINAGEEILFNYNAENLWWTKKVCQFYLECIRPNKINC